MFMYNLLFNFGNNDGTFDDLQGAGPLQQSKHWLRLPNLDPGAVFNPEGVNPAQWGNPLRGTLLIPHGGNVNATHAIGLRIAPTPASAGALAADATLDIAVAFGRPTVAAQNFASPFEDAANATLATFIQRGMVRAVGVTGWFLRLSAIKKQPPDPNVTHRYEFAVGVIVNSGGLVRTYGEDPEFDIGT